MMSRIVLSQPNYQHSGSIAILGFFAPQGRHVAPIGVKFGMTNFTPLVQQ